jgi:hypothetical protein
VKDANIHADIRAHTAYFVLATNNHNVQKRRDKKQNILGKIG